VLSEKRFLDAISSIGRNSQITTSCHLKLAKFKKGGDIFGVCNVVGSSIPRAYSRRIIYSCVVQRFGVAFYPKHLRRRSLVACDDALKLDTKEAPFQESSIHFNFTLSLKGHTWKVEKAITK